MLESQNLSGDRRVGNKYNIYQKDFASSRRHIFCLFGELFVDDTLKLAIENLYLTFNSYGISNPEEVGCFDFGPSPEELAGISKPLRDIPDDTLRGMEFFAYDWDSWGSKNEIGYFLPRLLEYLVEDIERLEDPGFFSLFNYKLINLFSETNDDWTEKQKDSLLNYFRTVLAKHLSNDTEIGFLIECVLSLDFPPQIIFSCWNTDNQTRRKQIKSLYDHFSYHPNQQDSIPSGVYFHNSERIGTFLDHLL